MVVKVYISGISGNKEVKKRQQRVLMILDSKNVKYELIDITEPGKEGDKDFMQNNSKSNGGTVSDPNPRSALPPQIFNDEEYCGDYDLFDLANEVDTLEQFLKVEVPPEEPLQVDSEKEKPVNGLSESKEENSEVKEEYETTEKVEETAGEKEKSPVKEASPAKEDTPIRDADGTASKEGTPAHDENDEAKGDTKDKSPVKEIEERQKSVEKESTPEKSQSPEKDLKTKQVSKENTPEQEEAVNENGTVSSREQSEDKDAIEDEKIDAIELKKDNPSEALIQSEQVAATE